MIDSDFYKTVLRTATWECQDVDHKAVGGHLPLMKRFSTPINASSPVTLQNNVPAATLLQHAHNSTNSTAMTSLEANLVAAAQQHRKLDRSLSEPVRQQQLQQQQQQQQVQGNSSRYKTELCRPYDENGFCKYGDKCQFAHGGQELRTMSRHPKYKTEYCRTFHSTGFCPYGPRCHFIHITDERNSSVGGVHQPLSASSSLTLGCGNSNYSNISTYLGSTADSPSPPSSLHGSPTIYGNTFFDEAFGRFQASQTLVDGINNIYANTSTGSLSPSGRLSSPNGSNNHIVDYDQLKEGSQLINFHGLETPPISPVESLAGDVDSLSLSSVPSDSPIPSTNIHGGSLLDINRNVFRLPIFEKLSEDK